MPKLSPAAKEPRTKADFIRRLLSYDFNGDLRTFFPGGCDISQVSENVVQIKSKASGRKFLLKLTIPRSAAVKQRMAAKRAARKAGKAPVHNATETRPSAPRVASAGVMAKRSVPQSDGASVSTAEDILAAELQRLST